MLGGSESSSLEIIHREWTRGDFRAAIFDFDGTLSLLRRNWQDVMIPLMVDELTATGSGETREQLAATVEEFVMQLNGRQTIYQMIRLAEEVEKRGTQAADPLEYKQRYHDRLWEEVGQRVAAVEAGRVPAEEMRVPGSHEILGALAERGVTLYLASGTDLVYVQNELRVLELDEFFGPRVYGALDDYRKFSKAMLIEQIVRDTDVAGSQLLGLGDGFVEIEEIKRVGGVAVGIASNEETRQGINPWKRERLVRAGADVIAADHREWPALLELLGI